jgi:putative ABC transport system substrate-binding protein
MQRREFITLIGSAAAAWPVAARAQQPEQMRLIGVLMNTTADDPEGQARIAAFQQGLQQLGWVAGRNVRIEYRWGAGNANLYRRYAPELVALAPDVLLAAGGTAAGALQQVIPTTVPIIFIEASDPVSRGLVASMAQPGGNTTGFVLYEFSMVGSGWSCSNRLRQTCHEWQWSGILRNFLGSQKWLPSRRQRHHLVWR